MRKLILSLVLFALPLTSCGSAQEVHTPALAVTPDASQPVAGTTAPRLTAQNPFGLMLPSRLVRSSQGMQIARALRVRYFRPSSILLDQWNGTCPECDIALKAGLQLVLTVRNNGRGQASSPPTDLAAYQRALGKVLDKYRPVILVVENEENSALFYTGTPEEYAAQLKAACQVAHQKGIPCANGGLVSMLVALLVYDYYLEGGHMAAAQDFAARAFTAEEQRQLTSLKAQEQVRKGKALLSSYRAAGADYVNFHWYIADPRTLGEAVAFLKAETGLPALTNEIGQHNDDPNRTTAIMDKVVELGLPIAVWFSVDALKARGLVNPDGTLRPTGQAFKRFIDGLSRDKARSAPPFPFVHKGRSSTRAGVGCACRIGRRAQAVAKAPSNSFPLSVSTRRSGQTAAR